MAKKLKKLPPAIQSAAAQKKSKKKRKEVPFRIDPRVDTLYPPIEMYY